MSLDVFPLPFETNYFEPNIVVLNQGKTPTDSIKIHEIGPFACSLHHKSRHLSFLHCMPRAKCTGSVLTPALAASLHSGGTKQLETCLICPCRDSPGIRRSLAALQSSAASAIWVTSETWRCGKVQQRILYNTGSQTKVCRLLMI